MRKSTLSILAAALSLASGFASAEYFDDRARVVSITPEYQQISTPRQECYDEPAPRRPYYRSEDRSYGGALIGGITGAIVGNQVGRGHGREAATAIGAVTGALVGDRIQNRNGDDSWDPRTTRRCRDVSQWENQLTGYRVMYEYGGHRYATVMSRDPGNYVRVRVSVDAYED